MSKWYIGIDFGTAFTYVMGYNNQMVKTDSHRCRLGSEKLYLSSDEAGQVFHGIPSILGLDESGNYSIGKQAMSLPEERTIRHLKYLLRNKDYDADTTIEKMIAAVREERSGLTLDVPKIFMQKPLSFLTTKFFYCLFDNIFKHQNDQIVGGRIDPTQIHKIAVGSPGTYEGEYSDIIKICVCEAIKMISPDCPIAKSADNVLIAEEPKLAANAVMRENLQAGRYLVVDVGGGTTDFTAINKEENGNISTIKCNGIEAMGEFEPAGNDFSQLLITEIEDRGWKGITRNEIEKAKMKLSSDKNEFFLYDDNIKKDSRFDKEKMYARFARISNKWIFFDEDDLAKYEDASKIFFNVLKPLKEDEYFLYNSDKRVDMLAGKIAEKAFEYVDAYESTNEGRYIHGFICVGGATRLNEIGDRLKEMLTMQDGDLSHSWTNLLQRGIDRSNAVAVGACRLAAGDEIDATVQNWFFSNKGHRHFKRERGKIVVDETVHVTKASELSFGDKSELMVISPVALKPFDRNRVTFKMHQDLGNGVKTSYPRFGPGLSFDLKDVSKKCYICIILKRHSGIEIVISSEWNPSKITDKSFICGYKLKQITNNGKTKFKFDKSFNQKDF